jgi:hypothetical protein
MQDDVTINDVELQALIAQVHELQLPVPAPVPAEAKDRRNDRWLVFDLRANLYWRGRDYMVKVCDMSLSGLGLEAAPKSILQDTQAILVMDLDEYGTLAVAVEIKHIHDGDHAQRLGVRFLPSHPEDMGPFNAYIADISQHESAAATR